MKTYSPAEIHKAFDINPATLRAWHTIDGLKVGTPGKNGRRRYSHVDMLLIAGVCFFTNKNEQGFLKHSAAIEIMNKFAEIDGVSEATFSDTPIWIASNPESGGWSVWPMTADSIFPAQHSKYCFCLNWKSVSDRATAMLAITSPD